MHHLRFMTIAKNGGDIHNGLANEKLKWRTPLEVNEGNTPDISKFPFHFYEPIWYYDANIKAPEDWLQKGWFLGFANTSGNELTYKVMTEKGNNKKCDVVLIQSLLKSRCKNIGKETEYVNEDPKYADFYLTPPAESNQHPSDSGTQPQGSGEEPSTGETGETTKQQNKSLVEQLKQAEPIMEYLNFLIHQMTQTSLLSKKLMKMMTVMMKTIKT